MDGSFWRNVAGHAPYPKRGLGARHDIIFLEGVNQDTGRVSRNTEGMRRKAWSLAEVDPVTEYKEGGRSFIDGQPSWWVTVGGEMYGGAEQDAEE